MKDYDLKLLYFSATHTASANEKRRISFFAERCMNFTKDELKKICDEVYNSLIFMLASCNETESIMSVVKCRNNYDFSFRSEIRFLFNLYHFSKNLNKNYDKTILEDYPIAKTFFTDMELRWRNMIVKNTG